MKICVCIGTRPEAIKLAPVIRALRNKYSDGCLVHLTGQHPDMAAEALAQFDLVADSVGNLSGLGPDLNARFGGILSQVERLARRNDPDWFVVHGDTATAAAAALGSFHSQVKVAHVEAGLRTGNLDGPWPEEGYRSMIARFARLHFASTASARENLRDEGIEDGSIVVTGNTVIDALLQTVDRLEWDLSLRKVMENWYSTLDVSGRMVLVTLHRRENHGSGVAGICHALRKMASLHPDVSFIIPIHPNPAVSGPVTASLADQPNIRLIQPVDYIHFVFLMMQSSLILTDSGGIQEEAPSLKRPVLVMRNETERPEAIEAGFARLTGATSDKIQRSVTSALAGNFLVPEIPNPFGDGKSSIRIAEALGATSAQPQPVVDKSRPRTSSGVSHVMSCQKDIHV